MRGITQHFKTVRLEINVKTNENAQRLQEVVTETELRCPVYNLIKNAELIYLASGSGYR